MLSGRVRTCVPIYACHIKETQVNRPRVFHFDVLNAAVRDMKKDLNDFNKCQIVMTRKLVVPVASVQGEENSLITDKIILIVLRNEWTFFSLRTSQQKGYCGIK